MTTTIHMRADPDIIFSLAAAVEDWPRILPHYRGVRLLRVKGSRRVVEMAANRDGIPIRWTAVQEVDRARRRMTFRHIQGITRGMDVLWTLTPSDHGVQVAIWHRFLPRWPLVPDVLIGMVIGRLFVENIATKTLRRIKKVAERRSRRVEPGT